MKRNFPGASPGQHRPQDPRGTSQGGMDGNQHRGGSTGNFPPRGGHQGRFHGRGGGNGGGRIFDGPGRGRPLHPHGGRGRGPMGRDMMHQRRAPPMRRGGGGNGGNMINRGPPMVGRGIGPPGHGPPMMGRPPPHERGGPHNSLPPHRGHRGGPLPGQFPPHNMLPPMEFSQPPNRIGLPPPPMGGMGHAPTPVPYPTLPQPQMQVPLPVQLQVQNGPPGIPPMGMYAQLPPQVAPVPAPVAYPAAHYSPGQQPIAAPTPYTHTQPNQVWQEHTAPSGNKFYFNSVTGVSTYTKPDALVQKETGTTPTTHSKENQKGWKEYADATTGKTYYSNGAITTWDRPAGFDAVDEKQIEKVEPPKKKKKAEAKKEPEFNDKAEAIAAFKGLLLAKAIAPAMKWHEVVKLCSSDSRWSACEKSLTSGDRKQALAEYQTKRANDLRTLERQEKARAKEAFGQMLTEILPSIQDFSPWGSRFSDIRASLSKEDRFYAVDDEGTRENLFVDFCEEMRKREERRKRSKKRETQEAFTSFLKEKEDAGAFTFASTWDTFFASLTDDEKTDSRFATSNFMSDSDRQLFFADAVIELQVAEDDKRRRIRDARRRAEKAQRDAFRGALRRLAVEGKILPYSQWRSAEECLIADDSYNPVVSQDREAPRELFEEFVEEWDDIYRRDRSLLSDLLHGSKKDISAKVDTKYDEFTKHMLDAASFSPELYGDVRRILHRDEPVSSARLYYDELMHRAKGGPALNVTRITNIPIQNAESSEDEGEIIEEDDDDDGEQTKDITKLADKNKPPNNVPEEITTTTTTAQEETGQKQEHVPDLAAKENEAIDVAAPTIIEDINANGIATSDDHDKNNVDAPAADQNAGNTTIQEDTTIQTEAADATGDINAPSATDGQLQPDTAAVEM